MRLGYTIMTMSLYSEAMPDEEWLKEQSELFYFAGIQKLRGRHRAAIMLKNKRRPMLVYLSFI